MTIEEIKQRIEKKHVKLSPEIKTCDGVIFGNTQQECTGILLTCSPNAAIIRKAAELRCNMIFCHEPTFYHGWDKTDRLVQNKIYQDKKALLEKNRIVIYRDHDRVHQECPDMIFSGLIRKLEWERYAVSKGFYPSSKYIIPETTLYKLALYVGDKMNIDGIRIMGDPDMKVKTVGIVAHFMGNESDIDGISDIEENDYDVVIPGDIVDWTIGTYIQDSNALGRKRGMLNVGHFNLEEPGMEMMKDWLYDILENQVPITYIQSGNQYGWVQCQKFK